MLYKVPLLSSSNNGSQTILRQIAGQSPLRRIRPWTTLSSRREDQPHQPESTLPSLDDYSKSNTNLHLGQRKVGCQFLYVNDVTDSVFTGFSSMPSVELAFYAFSCHYPNYNVSRSNRSLLHPVNSDHCSIMPRGLYGPGENSTDFKKPRICSWHVSRSTPPTTMRGSRNFEPSFPRSLP